MSEPVAETKPAENVVVNTTQNMEAETAPPAQQQVNLLDVEVNDENTALNVMVTFLNAAQRRGAFSMPESAKIWECIKIFQRMGPPNPNLTVAENPTEATDSK